MTFEEYCDQAENYYRANIGGIRKGQAYMTYLTIVNPRLENEIVGTDADPYYNDGLLPHFLQVIQERW